MHVQCCNYTISCKITAPGQNTINPQIIKTLSPETLKNLLDMYNRIWEEGDIPKTWKHTTITPLLNEGKTQKLLGVTNQEP